MKALFLGNVAADTPNGIAAQLPPELRVEILADPRQLIERLELQPTPTFSSPITGVPNTRRR